LKAVYINVNNTSTVVKSKVAPSATYCLLHTYDIWN